MLGGPLNDTNGHADRLKPIPFVVPTHQAMRTGSTLTGFSGGQGVETKQALLRLERGVIAVALTVFLEPWLT